MKLPVVSGRDCVKALEKSGFIFKRQRSSHIILMREHHYSLIVVPDHATLDRGTLRAIIRQTGLAVDEFLKLL
ncbi:type II toxin-antitoxin system HicA family toxin [Candidatus Magnetomonas plexicatena]|uniref:type II toxin-antitoxin system HicA family toxin n=1 Tax=Candidatus Magnetomonas plexicatena TaxID=2552947 RepID=UPI001C74CFFD|nr:addiction module toxin, HicA family [Nitrospirales bacterium LBB_01]